MLTQFEAIFEDGVLRPLKPVSLTEKEQVKVTVSRSADDEWLDTEYMEACRAEADPTVTLEQVRKVMSKIRSSMDEAIDEDRGDY
jgi:predicted DNA-binding antitoxin AbrB/MazE fold protein